jgi:hypothetical protein
MKRKKLTPEESLQRIKLMMNYDISRTLNEQLESPWGIVKKTGIATGAATGLGAVAGSIAAPAAVTASLGSSAGELGIILGGGTLASAGAIGGAVLGGAAALALTPLVLWLIDKDKAYPKTKKLFEYVKNNKEKIDQVERGLDDDTIQALSDDLYNAMKGLGTRNKLLFSVFNSLVTVSDLSALISTFNEDHLNEGDGDLLEWLDSDIDISSTWNKIYVPVRNLVKKFAKQLVKENPPEDQSTPNETQAAGSGNYKPCTGTYSFGCQSDAIAKVQKCLGGLVIDGKFGPKTQVKLDLIGRAEGFTDDDVMSICRASAITSKPPTVPTSNLKLSSLAPKMDNKLYASKQPVSPERMKEIQSNIRRGKKYVGPPLNNAETAWLNDYLKKSTGKVPQMMA